MMEKLYLVARIADTRVALRSRGIHSVVTVGTPVEVPGAPPHVAGLFALRSRVFTLIDPHVVEVAEHGYALLADEIEDVCFIEAPETRIAGKLLPGWARVADAMIEHDGASLLVVDPSNFITLPALKAA